MALHEAFFYKSNGEEVVCTLCAHTCRVSLNKRGRCGVRRNVDGKLYSIVYGELVAENIDPIEKKPLFHLLPGSNSLSISTVGCNFHCHHCQNNSISQVAGFTEKELRGREFTPLQVVEKAIKGGCSSISYTYVEPTVFFEFAFDCAEAAKDQGVRNVFVSNGYLTEVATRKIAPFLSAINIDLKSHSDEFYKKICGARLQPVLDCIRLMKDLGVWVEVTTLLIPGLNDSNDELKRIASFLVSVDASIPWHVTAFHPMYKMQDRQPTSLADLKRARQIGRDSGLLFVYEGNVPGSGGENTYCPKCGDIVIKRHGFSIRENNMVNGACRDCGTIISGVWD